MQLERGTFFFLWGTSVVTHFFFHKIQQILFLPDKGTVHQLWLIRGWLEATGASIHKGPGSPLAPGKTGLGPSAAPCGFRNTLHFSSVQSLSRVQLFVTPWTAACQATLSITNSRSLLKLTSIELVMPSNHLVLCRPLLLPPSIFASIRVFSDESVLRIRWQKYWNFSFSIGPSNEYSGLISFRMGSLDLLAV